MLPIPQKEFLTCKICKNPILHVNDLLMVQMGDVHRACYYSAAGMNNTVPLTSPRICKACSSIIEGDYSKLAGADYHSNCLACSICKKPKIKFATGVADICTCSSALKSPINVQGPTSRGSTSNTTTPTKEPFIMKIEKQICAVCRIPFVISDRILKIGDIRMHQRCAAAKQHNTLNSPKKSLEDFPSPNKQQIPFSKEDVASPNKNETPSEASVCVVCLIQIPESEIKVVGKLKFHEKCMKCEDCSKSLKEGQFYINRNSRIKCLPCKEKQTTLPTLICQGCSKSITDKDFLNVLGYPFHQTCFGCQECKGALRGKFYYSQAKYICESCYLKKPKVCFSCNKPIMGRMFFVKDGYFHFECFSCCICKKSIGDSTYVMMNNNPAHFNCIKNLKGASMIKSGVVAKKKKPLVPDNHLILKKKLSDIKEEDFEESVIYNGEKLISRQASELLNSVDLEENEKI